VKDRDTNKVALIAGVLMIVIVVTTQWENIASLVKSPGPPNPVQDQTNQANLVTLAHTNTPPPPGKITWPPDARPHDERIANGEKLSLQFCGGCHLRPKPDVLTQAAWGKTLPWMSIYLGMLPPDKGLHDPTGFERVMAARVFPAKPMMPIRDWKDIVDYYIQTAPKKLPITNQPSISLDLNLFEPFKPERKFDAAVMTVRVNHQEGGLWVMHEASNTLYRLDTEYQWMPGIKNLKSPVSAIISSNDGILATLIGSFTPSFDPQGALVRFGGDKVESLSGILHRPTDVLPLDLNQDGREDLAITEHGNMLGSVFWLEKKDSGYERHMLLDLPGALNFASGHFNDDGIPDLVTLTGQAREAVHLFLSTGSGKFEHRMILMRHPAWGHSHIEVVDFNKDNHPDLLITNGDNGELDDYPPKPYNGIRLHLNDGKNNFIETFFFPQYGAYRAVAKDFDGDGDLDIASIAYFGRYDLSPDTGFVYLQQDKPLEFSAHSLPASRSGRWLTMDTGDIDQDGDIDIALGALNDGPGQDNFPPQFNNQWQKNPVPVLILKNRTK
jgi:hypothetical protein